MIEYARGPYGANLLLRWHGSALAKAFLPGLLGAAIFAMLHYSPRYGITSGGEEYLDHPYAIGVLVSSVTFLIIFRANYGYQRYWEACTMAHKLMSKFMDFTHFVGVFHLRNLHYKEMRPPSFFHQGDRLNGRQLTRGRERPSAHHQYLEMVASVGSADALGSVFSGSVLSGDHIGSGDQLGRVASPPPSLLTSGSSPTGSRDDGASSSASPNQGAEDCTRAAMLASMKAESRRSLRRRRYQKSINQTVRTGSEGDDVTAAATGGGGAGAGGTPGGEEEEEDGRAADDDDKYLLGPPRLDGGWGSIFPDAASGGPTATFHKMAGGRGGEPDDPAGFASTRGGRTPSLFLQELAHLASLLCAVAFATLRGDLDDVETPLAAYVPGAPWPAPDPIDLPKDIKHDAYHERGRVVRNVCYLLGIDQTKRARTVYNAARPMLVIGGVSDNEVAFIQRARGPYAKTQLVWGWLTEFMIREHLAGSLGDVGAPILSRIVQFLGDGMLYYNHARKIMFTPFPFPHAQLSAFFVLTMVVAIPLLMEQYTNEAWLGACLSFLTVTCLAGLHEVARELENPFRNAPNDVPLCTLLAFYNEALICMYAGYHPDSYWDEADAYKRGAGAPGGLGGGGGTDGPGGGGVELPPLIPELSAVGEANGTTTPATPAGGAGPVPQSAENVDSLRDLKEMIESQAAKIKELQERMRKKNADGGRPQTAPSGYVSYDTPT